MSICIKPILFSLVCLAFLTGCPGSEKDDGKPLNKEKFLRPRLINPALEKALYKVIKKNGPEKIDTSCPEQVLKMLGKKGNSLQFHCGARRVPEYHNMSNSNNLGISFFHASKNKNAKKPLLVLEQGGPGGSSIMLASYYIENNPKILNDFDILAVEQRGTKWTRPKATCDELIVARLKILDSPNRELNEEKLNKGCHRKVSKKMDIKNISTYQIAADIPMIVQDFGYQNFSYYGVSYGTLVGQYLIEYHAKNLNKIVLDSPVIAGKEWKSDAYPNMDRVFEKNMKSFVRKHNKTGKWTKNYKQTLKFIKSQFYAYSENPVYLTYNYNNFEYGFLFDASGFLSTVFSASISSYSSKGLLYLLKASEIRNSDPGKAQEMLTLVNNHYYDVDSDISQIMYQAIICREFDIDNFINEGDNFPSEFWPQIMRMLPDEVADAIDSDFGTNSSCYLNIEKNDASIILSEPNPSDYPVLIVGGEVDHVTHPKYVSELATFYSQSQTNVFKSVGHGVFSEKKCIDNSIINYLKSSENNFINFCK